MKICLLKFYGWPETFNERVKRLADRVDELIIIKPKNKDEAREPSTVAENISVVQLYPSRQPVMKPRIKTLFIPLYTAQALLFYFFFVWPYGNCDVFHSFDRPFASLAAWGLASLTGKPHIASVRGLVLPRYEARGSLRRQLQNTVLRMTLAPLITRSLRSCDHIITKAHFQRAFIREITDINVKSISTIPTGVDFDLFNPGLIVDDKTVIQDVVEQDINDQEHIVVFIGKLVPGKGADTFVEHVSSGSYSDDVHFLMIGEFLNREFEEQLRERIAGAGVADQITIHADRIPFEGVPQLIAEAGAVSLLSRSGVEGTPRILQEACVMNTPIIASDVDGIHGVFGGCDGCYLIDRDETSQFADAVRESRTVKPDREEFSGVLDIEKNYDQYIRIYRDAINNGHA